MLEFVVARPDRFVVFFGGTRHGRMGADDRESLTGVLHHWRIQFPLGRRFNPVLSDPGGAPQISESAGKDRGSTTVAGGRYVLFEFGNQFHLGVNRPTTETFRSQTTSEISHSQS